jgi:pyruvate dehydrogenase E1 component beta subunit
MQRCTRSRARARTAHRWKSAAPRCAAVGDQRHVLAAALLAKQGVDAEVIDLRTLRPLDIETILASVARTHRAVIVEEAWKTAGFAAEVSACIMEGAFDALDAPVARVCGAEVPMPYAQHMEQAALPQPEAIVKAVQGLF